MDYGGKWTAQEKLLNKKGKKIMAAKKTNKKEAAKKENNFKEFNAKFADIPLSGRIYEAKENKGIKRSFMYLNIGGGFTIQCHFVETKNNYFIAFPQYESNGSYKSYVFIEKDSKFDKAFDALADWIYNEGNGSDDEIATDGKTELPF